MPSSADVTVDICFSFAGLIGQTILFGVQVRKVYKAKRRAFPLVLLLTTFFILVTLSSNAACAILRTVYNDQWGAPETGDAFLAYQALSAGRDLSSHLAALTVCLTGVRLLDLVRPISPPYSQTVHQALVMATPILFLTIGLHARNLAYNIGAGLLHRRSLLDDHFMYDEGVMISFIWIAYSTVLDTTVCLLAFRILRHHRQQLEAMLQRSSLRDTYFGGRIISVVMAAIWIKAITLVFGLALIMIGTAMEYDRPWTSGGLFMNMVYSASSCVFLDYWKRLLQHDSTSKPSVQASSKLSAAEGQKPLQKSLKSPL